MKEYLFSRDLLNKAIIEVREGEKIYPLDHMGAHSPKGMDFGFDNSGSADTAISVLSDYLGVRVDEKICQTFKDRFISYLPQEVGGIITEKQIEDWLKMNAPKLLGITDAFYLYHCPICDFQLSKNLGCPLCGNYFEESAAKVVGYKLS